MLESLGVVLELLLELLLLGPDLLHLLGEALDADLAPAVDRVQDGADAEHEHDEGDGPSGDDALEESQRAEQGAGEPGEGAEGAPADDAGADEDSSSGGEDDVIDAEFSETDK